MKRQTERFIKEMVRRIVAGFNPEKVILFGSYARGTAGTDSDVDLLVVMRVMGSKRKTQPKERCEHSQNGKRLPYGHGLFPCPAVR